MTEHGFPDADAFARYRSGLLDGDPEMKRRIGDMLATQPDAAREREALHTVTTHLDQATDRQLSVANELRRRRREVVSGHRRLAPPRYGLSALAASAVTSIVMGIAIGLVIGRATVSPTLPLVALEESEDAGDVVENLDFYDWLEGQHTSGQTPPQAGT